MKKYKEHIAKKVECIKGKYKGVWFFIVGWDNRNFICKIVGGDIDPGLFRFPPSSLVEVIERTIYKKIKLK